MAKFELTTFIAPAKENEWIEPITALHEATKTDPNAAIRVNIDVNDENKELMAIRSAAKEVGRTVRVRVRDDSAVTKIGTKENGKSVYQGELSFTLTLTDKYKDGRGRKPANGGAGEAPEAPEAPEAEGKSGKTK